MPGGHKKITPKDGKQFSSTYQPDRQKVIEGKRRVKLLKDIAALVITGQLKEDLTPLCEELGIDPESVDIEKAMHLKQMEKALKDGDTKAYQALFDRLKGKPVQAVIDKTPPKPIVVSFDPLNQEPEEGSDTPSD